MYTLCITNLEILMNDGFSVFIDIKSKKPVIDDNAETSQRNVDVS